MELANSAGVADAQSPEGANMDGGEDGKLAASDEQRLALAISRICERFEAEPSEFVLVDSVAAELALLEDADTELAELLDLFGRVCWAHMQHNGVGKTPRQKAHAAARDAKNHVLPRRRPRKQA